MFNAVLLLGLGLKFDSPFLLAVEVTVMSMITLLFIQRLKEMLWFKCQSKAGTFAGRKLFAKT
jgi:hypothetical protein